MRCRVALCGDEEGCDGERIAAASRTDASGGTRMSASKTLDTATVLHELDCSAVALEVIFRGAHGTGVARQVQRFLIESVREHRPALLIVNLLDFKYQVGDDIGAALVTAWVDLRRLGSERQCRILARGRTAKSLHCLLEITRTLPMFGGHLFSDLESALDTATVQPLDD